MAGNDLELQLKVWKELAISKQILIRTATDALKLDPNCSQEEFKVALEVAIKRSLDADVRVSKTQEQAKAAITALEKELADTKKLVNRTEAAYAEAVANQEKLQQQMGDQRNHTALEVNRLKEQLAEKERALKAINTALSDTPENVAKKLKALQKQKRDESDARKRAEEAEAALRKDKRTLEQQIKEMETAQGKATQLAAQYRELHALSESLHNQLKPLVEDVKSLPSVPALDNTLLESFEKAGAPEEKTAAAKGKR